ncbi:transposase [Paenibacillus dendritiformis]|uniref:transposase n=1 Tax=Paenibacillus dendritiformis TaxID=130049 RepID=UPI00140E53D9|nr:transposase [Paenibacillus dendritiformis]
MTGLLQLLPLSKRVVLGGKVTPGNVHDSQAFEDVLEEAARLVPATQAVTTDAGYKTPAICKTLQEREIRPVLPYTRPQTKESFFKKYEYVYNDHYICYLCPANAVLSYETTNRDGYKMYRSNPAICKKWRPCSGRPVAPLPRLQY